MNPDPSMQYDPLDAFKHFDPQFHPPFGQPSRTLSPPPRPPSSLPRKRSFEAHFTEEQMEAIQKVHRQENGGSSNVAQPQTSSGKTTNSQTVDDNLLALASDGLMG